MQTKNVTLALFALIAAAQAAPLSDRTSLSLQLRGDACSEDPGLPQCVGADIHDTGSHPVPQPSTNSVPAPPDAAVPHHPPPPPPAVVVTTSIFQDHNYIWLKNTLYKFFGTLF